MIKHVISAYKWWEETTFPVPSRRLGLPARILKQIYEVGISSAETSVVRDAAMVIFAYVLSSLRDSSVVSIAAADVEVTDCCVRARLSYVKGRPASREQPVEYTGDLLDPSPFFDVGCQCENPTYGASPCLPSLPTGVPHSSLPASLAVSRCSGTARRRDVITALTHSALAPTLCRFYSEFPSRRVWLALAGVPTASLWHASTLTAQLACARPAPGCFARLRSRSSPARPDGSRQPVVACALRVLRCISYFSELAFQL
jgi:hypothetical protein